MMNRLLVCFFCMACFVSKAQGDWSFVQISSMPEPTAMNVVTSVNVGPDQYVYSFGGASQDLNLSSIHQNIVKYNVSSGFWQNVNVVLDTIPKLGYDVSVVDNIMYIIGGTRYQNGEMTDLSTVQVFNPFTDTLEPNGASLLKPVSNHQQFVWRDSLIYVVSGWSNGELIADVQLFNPFFDTWEMATPLPESTVFKSAGGSGYIIQDTIYYWGGTNATNGALTNNLRKGIIDVENPVNIEWLNEGETVAENIYRPLASGHSETVFWYGGTKTFFELRDEQWQAGVLPKAHLLMFGTRTSSFELIEDIPFAQYGVKGMAKLGGGNWLIAGGIDSLNHVTSRAFLLNNVSLSDWDLALQPPLFEIIDQGDQYLIQTENIGSISVFDITGRRLYFERKQLADITIDKMYLNAPMLFFVFDDGVNVPVPRKIIPLN